MKKEPASEEIEDKLVLKLYISGMSPKSLEAVQNIQNLCNEYLTKDAFDLEIIDIYKNPELATKDGVVFSPSLIKLFPAPRKILIGTLKNPVQVLKALGITF